MQTYDVVSLAQTLIRYPSVTPESNQIIDFLDKLLTSMGFTCQRMDFQSEGRPAIANLFARYGTEGPHICYAGHVDVVPEGLAEFWAHDPYAAQIDREILYGRGAVDMKGSIAAFIAAVSTKLSSGTIKGSISLLITGDEEGDAVDGTVRVLEELKKQGQIPDVCLVGEPSSDAQVGDTIKVGRRGSLSGHIIVEGKQGHVAYPQRADNPVRRLTKFLNELQLHQWDQGSALFDPSNLEVTAVNTDNRAVNVIPQRAEAQFNIRYNDHHTAASLKAAIEDMASAHCKHYQLNYRPGAEPFSNRSQTWVDLVVQSVESVIKHKPLISTSGGTSDARFIHTYCPVIELGLSNHTAHQIDEHVSLADLRTLQQLYGAILDRFLFTRTME